MRRLCDASRDGAIQLVTSMLTVAECLHIEEEPGPSEETKALFRDFLTSGTVVELIDPDIFIAERARALFWDHDVKIKGADAIHVATAMIEDCQEFLILDGRIHREGSKFSTALPLIAKAGLPALRPSQSTLLQRSTEAMTSSPKIPNLSPTARPKAGPIASDQSERFKQAARELGCDDDPERFKQTVRKLAKSPPAPGPSKAKMPLR